MTTAYHNYPIFLLILLLTAACSDSSDEGLQLQDGDEHTLRSYAPFPLGNVIYLEDDPRFTQYRSSYYQVLDIVNSEFDYVGHDEIFRIRETHPAPHTTHYEQLDAFVEFAMSEGYRVHGHNLLFYSDIGPDSWIAEYRRNGTWSQEQWRVWFEQYIKDKVGRYKGKVASWDVLNEPLPRVILDDLESRSIFTDLAGEDIYARAFQWAREADPNATLVLNEFFLGPDGARKTDDLIALADDIGRKGGKVDVLGFEGIYFFAPMVFSSYSYNYDRFKKAADAGYMVTLSELNVALNTFPAEGKYQVQTRQLHSVQRKAFNNIIRAYMDAVPEPQRWGVVTWGVTDYYGFTRFGDIFKGFRAPGGGSEWPLLWNDEQQRKPSYFGFMSALKGTSEPFIYADVYAEGDLIDDAPLEQDFKAALREQLEEDWAAVALIPTSTSAEERYYQEVILEIENSPDQ
jgi:endo-1,4-beta-xylanase